MGTTVARTVSRARPRARYRWPVALGQAAPSQRGRMKGQVTLQPVKSADRNTSEGNNSADKGEADRKGGGGAGGVLEQAAAAL